MFYQGYFLATVNRDLKGKNNLFRYKLLKFILVFFAALEINSGPYTWKSRYYLAISPSPRYKFRKVNFFILFFKGWVTTVYPRWKGTDERYIPLKYSISYFKWYFYYRDCKVILHRCFFSFWDWGLNLGLGKYLFYWANISLAPLSFFFFLKTLFHYSYNSYT